jgi:hypothetical protein
VGDLAVMAVREGELVSWMICLEISEGVLGE